MTTPDRARALRVASLLLAYPDGQLYERLPLLRTASMRTGAASSHLAAFFAELDTIAPGDAQASYVDTFDLRRRCCLYLTYYTYGDTRKRGMALLRFTHAFRSAGFELVPSELPDHLAVVCEFTAHAPDAGLRLLREHRAGLELLRLALADATSPYVHVVDAIRVVLPDPAPKDLERALQLVETGPPAEEVGLAPFGPPESHGMQPTGGRR